MSNPYQPPSADSKEFSEGPAPYPPPMPGGYGMVQQVRIVAILNAVQGGLEILMGLLTVAMGGFMWFMPQIDRAANQGRPRPPSDPPDEFFWVLAAVYGGLGLAVLAGGILRIAACVQNYRYQGRTLGIVALAGGMASVLSCYCAPTALALLVYGLVIFLHPAVVAAFEMRRQGYAVDAILAAFMPYPPMQYPAQPQLPPGNEPRPGA